MADFSFSFDPDNPFAEPEQTPKEAKAPADEAVAEASVPAAAPNPAPESAPEPASDTDEFSLDSFDFAFDEDASINDSLPTRNTPTDGTLPPRKLTPGEAAFAEHDFNAIESAEAPAVEAPAVEAVEVEAVEVEAVEVEAPAVEVEAVEVETAGIETAEVEFFEAETPEFESSAVEAPEVEAPMIEDLEVETLEVEAFGTKDSAAEALEVEMPKNEDSAVEAPELSASEETADSSEDSRSARSDLEEFNAFTYDFGLPEDETFDAENEEQTEPVAEEPMKPVADELPTEESSDVLESENPVAEVLEIEAPAEEISETDVAVAEVQTEESATPRQISTRNVVGDALLLASHEEGSESQAEGEFRRLKTKATLNVAVLGASGIGKNHARWFHRHGCQVVGFLGTSPETTTQTESDLSADFDFQGNAYTDLETLLQTEEPDIVCVATPPPLHFGQVLQSLEAGAHVLCEKPLVYAPTRKFRENRDGAKELVKVAAKRKLNLGTQLQYGGATPILCKLAGLSPADVGDFAMELETVNPNSSRDPRELWVDLGPHPVSVAQMLAGPGSTLAEETIVFEPFQDDDKTEVIARFGINCADGRLLMVRAVVRALNGENPRKPRRRFSFNGHAVTYAPLQSAKNGFQAQFVAPDGYASVYPDPVDYLIGNFVNACRSGEAPMISGDFGRENLEWMLKVGMPAETR